MVSTQVGSIMYDSFGRTLRVNYPERLPCPHLTPQRFLPRTFMRSIGLSFELGATR